MALTEIKTHAGGQKSMEPSDHDKSLRLPQELFNPRELRLRLDLGLEKCFVKRRKPLRICSWGSLILLTLLSHKIKLFLNNFCEREKCASVSPTK